MRGRAGHDLKVPAVLETLESPRQIAAVALKGFARLGEMVQVVKRELLELRRKARPLDFFSGNRVRIVYRLPLNEIVE